MRSKSTTLIDAVVAKEKTNLSNTKQDSKVNNFISLRKENTKFRTNEIKEPFLKSDQYVNGYIPSYSTLKENRKLGNSGSIYTSANGITYERTSSDGVVQTTLDFPKNALDIPGKYHELYRHSVVSDEIPQNIRHKFGSKDTKQLLADQVKVHDTLSSIQNAGIIKKVDRTKSTSYLNTDKIMVEKYSPAHKNEDYLDLGNYLRHAVCRGFPLVNSKGTTFYDYNPDTSKKFLHDKDNFQNANRRTKDWLGNWSELSLKCVDTQMGRHFPLPIKTVLIEPVWAIFP